MNSDSKNLAALITSYYMTALLINYTIPASVMIETMGAEFFLKPLKIKFSDLTTLS